jgi:hypothetical protein
VLADNPSFDALRHSHRKGAIVFYAFDLLYFDGEDISQYPLVGRKEALRRILRKTARARIRYTEHIAEQSERLFAQLEGNAARRNGLQAQGQRLCLHTIETVAESENYYGTRSNAEAH